MDDGHYEALVGAIIYQQLAGSAARAILDRFKKIYGGKIPDPKQYLSTHENKLRASGLSPQKISYIRDLCERIVKGSLDLPSLTHLSDEEAVERLDEIRGVGRWTAEMFLLFVLGRKDVLPVDDLGVQKAVKKENLSLAEAAIKEEVRTVGKELASLLLHRDTVLVAERGDQSEACQVVREGTLDQRLPNYLEVRNYLLDECSIGDLLAVQFLTIVPLELKGWFSTREADADPARPSQTLRSLPRASLLTSA